MKALGIRLALVLLSAGGLAVGSARASTLDAIPAPYHDAYTGGFDAGFSLGYGRGFDQGHARGTTAGTLAGDEDGYADGWDEAYAPAYEEAFAALYDSGVELGFADGVQDGFDSGVLWAYEQDRISFSSGILVNSGNWVGGGSSITGFDLSGLNQWSGGGTTSGTLSISSGALVDWSAHYYTLGFGEGKTAGTSAGDVAGYDAAYPGAYQAAYDAAFVLGGDEGYAAGVDDGSTDGFDAGWNDGYDEAYPLAFDEGVLAYANAKQSPDWSGTLSGLTASETQFSLSNRVPEPTACLLALVGAIACRRLRGDLRTRRA